VRRLYVRGADAVTPHQLRGSPTEVTAWSFLFVSYLMVLFQILGDIFRNPMSGWLKAVWLIALIIIPFVSELIYLIVRGQGMAVDQTESITRSSTLLARWSVSAAWSPAPGSAAQRRR
jgi:predicted permease